MAPHAIVVLLAALALAGCSCGSPRVGMKELLLRAFVYAPDRDLLIALRAYHAGAGHWPVTPADLAAAEFLRSELHFSRYQNLRFTPLAGGGLTIEF